MKSFHLVKSTYNSLKRYPNSKYKIANSSKYFKIRSNLWLVVKLQRRKCFLVWIKSFDYSWLIGVSEGWSETFATFALIENPKTSKVKTFINLLNCFLFGVNSV
jgi:hypothetical protein